MHLILYQGGEPGLRGASAPSLRLMRLLERSLQSLGEKQQLHRCNKRITGLCGTLRVSRINPI